MSQGKIDFLILYIFNLILLSVLTVRPIVSYFIRLRKYGRIPSSSESREKMKFVTPLSKDEVIEGLRSHKANDIFEYEFRSESDMVYILLIKGIGRFNLGCKGNVKYKLVIAAKPENTVVWVVLYESDNEIAVERYSWELKGFMEKKIMAVRVE